MNNYSFGYRAKEGLSAAYNSASKYFSTRNFNEGYNQIRELWKSFKELDLGDYGGGGSKRPELLKYKYNLN